MSVTRRIVAASRKVGCAIRARVTRRRHTTTTATSTSQPIEAVATKAADTSNTAIAKLLAEIADEVEACERDVEAHKKATLKTCEANAKYKATANIDRNEAGVEYHQHDVLSSD
ncbi:hypothetical protein GGI03_000612 [Coemansia sp. RSA 2337]|nr:hypothetical protein GGI08_008574 [Coemansia sp. S2]KAJ2469070.1 hypothetical protein GGI03_000612 [Coemansia sp. RSA 2337]